MGKKGLKEKYVIVGRINAGLCGCGEEMGDRQSMKEKCLAKL